MIDCEQVLYDVIADKLYLLQRWDGDAYINYDGNGSVVVPTISVMTAFFYGELYNLGDL